MTPSTRLRLAAVLALVLCTCAPKIEPIKSRSEEKVPLNISAIPPQIFGLNLRQESIGGTLEEATRAHYVDATALFSLRQPDDQMQATLQISRFHPDPEFKSLNFRRSIVAQIGATNARVLLVEGRPVYFTTSKGLQIAIWFSERHMFVLGIRQEFPNPKTLVRASLGINP